VIKGNSFFQSGLNFVLYLAAPVNLLVALAFLGVGGPSVVDSSITQESSESEIASLQLGLSSAIRINKAIGAYEILSISNYVLSASGGA